jgi:hypothetical protein
VMNIRFWYLAALLEILPLSTHAQSVQPFYTASDIVFRQELIGKWNIEDVTIEFRDLGDKTYGISIPVDSDVTIQFRAHLIRIAGKYFLDGQITQLRKADKASTDGGSKDEQKEKSDGGFTLDEHDIFMNRHHGLILIEFTKNPDELIAHEWADNWLPEMAEHKKLDCPHIKDEMGRILLTAESSELQKFVKRLPPEAFDSGAGLTRIKEPQAKVAEPKVSTDTKSQAFTGALFPIRP